MCVCVFFVSFSRNSIWICFSQPEVREIKYNFQNSLLFMNYSVRATLKSNRSCHTNQNRISLTYAFVWNIVTTMCDGPCPSQVAFVRQTKMTRLRFFNIHPRSAFIQYLMSYIESLACEKLYLFVHAITGFRCRIGEIIEKTIFKRSPRRNRCELNSNDNRPLNVPTGIALNSRVRAGGLT